MLVNAITINILVFCKSDNLKEDQSKRRGSIWRKTGIKQLAKNSIKMMDIIATYDTEKQHIFVREIELDVQREEIEEYIRLQTGKSVPLLLARESVLVEKKKL